MGCHDCLTLLPKLLSCDCLALGFDRLSRSSWVRWLWICIEMSVVGVPVHLAIGKPHSTRRLVRCPRVAHQGGRASIRGAVGLAPRGRTMRRVFRVRPRVAFDVLLARRPKGLSELCCGGIIMQSGLHPLRHARMSSLSRSLSSQSACQSGTAVL